jgi:hypothetical protein
MLYNHTILQRMSTNDELVNRHNLNYAISESVVLNI